MKIILFNVSNMEQMNEINNMIIEQQFTTDKETEDFVFHGDYAIYDVTICKEKLIIEVK